MNTTDLPETDSGRLTAGLLLCGMLSAPLFYAVVLFQYLTRPGADIHRLPLSVLSLGDLGWLQISNFLLTGLLALAGAMGMRRAWAGGRGGTFGPLLLGAYGLGLILAGIFHPDPGYGFPPGAPAGANPVTSAHAMVHNAGFLIVVLSLIAACFVVARGFRARGLTAWRTYSIVTGFATPTLLVFAITTHTILAITAMGAVAFGWASLVFLRLRSDLHASRHGAETLRAGDD